MKRFICSIFLVAVLMADIVYGVTSEEGPLTLMKEPQQQGQNSNAQQIPQMPQLQQDQAMKMYDIYGVVPTRGSVPILYIILGALVVFALAALVYWLYKRGRRVVAAPEIPPWERALAELEVAKTYQNISQGRLYMDRASQILRDYIEQRFAIKTTRKTTREFLQSLRKNSSLELNNYRAELQSCLEQADMAKFAHQIHDEQNLIVMEQAVSTFVHSTRPGDGDKEGVK